MSICECINLPFLVVPVRDHTLVPNQSIIPIIVIIIKIRLRIVKVHTIPYQYRQVIEDSGILESLNVVYISSTSSIVLQNLI